MHINYAPWQPKHTISQYYKTIPRCDQPKTRDAARLQEKNIFLAF
jgi:hypothetical protein